MVGSSAQDAAQQTKPEGTEVEAGAVPASAGTLLQTSATSDSEATSTEPSPHSWSPALFQQPETLPGALKLPPSFVSAK